MTRGVWTVAAGAAMLWAAAALATTIAQQNCDNARITAWKKYLSCADTALAKVAQGTGTKEPTAYGKCRHTYSKKWTAFQANASVAGSTCVGNRFTDNGTTVTDNLSGLVWEKKTTDSTVHDQGNLYTWSTGPPYFENGTAFTSFLGTVNGGSGFAGANGWRLPTLAELESIVLDFPCKGQFGDADCTCPSPCIDSTFGPTQPNNFPYWSVTSYLANPLGGRGADFNFNGFPDHPQKTDPGYVRAVRGGL